MTIRLGRQDSNLRMTDPKSVALPLGYAPVPFNILPRFAQIATASLKKTPPTYLSGESTGSTPAATRTRATGSGGRCSILLSYGGLAPIYTTLCAGTQVRLTGSSNGL